MKAYLLIESEIRPPKSGEYIVSEDGKSILRAYFDYKESRTILTSLKLDINELEDGDAIH